MLTVVALLLLVIPAPGFSAKMDMPMRGGGDRPGHMMDMGDMDNMHDMMAMCMRQADKMGLTDVQIEKIKPIHNEILKKHARFEADVKIAKIELSEIMDVKDFDLAKAVSATEKIGAIKAAYRVEMLKAMKEMRTVLTDDQFKKMKRMMFIKPDLKKQRPRK
jgi:Spy/CpxP family protein refolding chaperone